MATKKTKAEIELSADISNFQKSINTINKDITTLNNQLKLNATQLKGDSDNVDLLKERQALLTTELEKAKQKVEDTSNKLETQKKLFGENSTAVQTTTNQLIKAQTQEQSIKNELDKVNNQIEEVTNSLEDNSEEIEDNRNAYEKLQDTISEQKNELSKLGTEYKSVVLEQGNSSDEAKELKEKIYSLNSELKENEKSLQDVDESAENAGNGGFTVFKGALADLTSNAIQECLSGLKDLADEVADVGLDFTSSMSKVQAISGATEDELATLEETAKNLGASTKFSASEVADGFQYMALAGWKTNDMVAAMPSILNLATASDMDLAEASDIVTDYLTAFGLTAEDSGKFVDQMSFAMSNSNTNVEQLGEAYKNCAATSTQLGYSLEDTTSALMVMANSGIKGGEAGTALSSIMTRLGNNTSSCRDILAEYGVEVYDTEGNVNSLSSILGGMKDVWANLTDEQKSNLSYIVAGKSAQSELMTVLSDSEGAFENYAQGLQDCTGSAQEMSDVMSNNLKGDLTEQNSLLEGLGISIFEDFEEPLRSVTNFINENVLGPLIDLNDDSGLVSSALSGVAVALGVLAVALGISVLISSVSKAMAFLNTTLLANPIVLIVALIAGLVVAFISLWNNCEEFRNFWINLGTSIKNVFTSAVDGVKKGIDSFVDKFNSAKTKISQIWNGITSFFGKVGTTIGNAISGAFKSVVNGVLSTVENFLNTPIRTINKFIGLVRKLPGLSGLSTFKTFSFPRLKVGIDYVPNDFYGPVYLDEGERVLTKEENARYNSSLDRVIENSVNSQNTTINNSVNMNKLDRTNELLENIANKDWSLYADTTAIAHAISSDSDAISGELIELRERGLEI